MFCLCSVCDFESSDSPQEKRPRSGSLIDLTASDSRWGGVARAANQISVNRNSLSPTKPASQTNQRCEVKQTKLEHDMMMADQAMQERLFLHELEIKKRLMLETIGMEKRLQKKQYF